MERRFTDEQIDKANSINIIDYAKSKGYPVNQVTPHSYKVPGYGGLYIHSGGLKWNRFSANTGGGTIQFVMHMENKTWVEAIKELLNISITQPQYYSKTETSKTKQERVKNIFQLPDKNDTFKHIFAYLIKTRKLDKQTVYDLVKQNKIYESKIYNSCIFVGYNKNGKAKYATVRGTGSSNQYRKDVTGSDKSYSFSVNIKEGTITNDIIYKTNRLFVFESPIDLISYLTLFKLYSIKNLSAHFISLGGVSELALERFLKENPDISEITLCLDNDEAGIFACEQIRQKYSDKYTIKRHLPKHKDFNEDLLNSVVLAERESKRDHQQTLFENTSENEVLLSQ